MITIIVGMTKERVIGKNNELPWYISEDLKNFKKLTLNNTVIMGRKTYDSIIKRIGKPLPNRNNIVISRSMQKQDTNSTKEVQVCRSMNEAIETAKQHNNEIYIIGGTSIYKEALPFAKKMMISYIKKEYEGDTYFPEFNQEEWEKESEQDFEEFTFTILRRK